MQELRVQIEAVPTVEGDILSAWFTLPIDEEIFSERLGVDAESNDYRITEKELPFAEEVDEDTTVDRLNDFYYTYESLPADLKEDYEELMCHFTSLDELHQHRHDIIHYSWCKNMADVAKHLLDNDPAFAEIDERLVRYFNFEAYGQHLDDNVAYHKIYEENVLGEIPPAFFHYIDCEAYGRDLDMGGCFIETSRGMCEIPY